MTLAEFLATVPELDDAAAADAWNASPHRFADAYRTPEGLIRNLGQQLADVVLGSLTAAAAASPALGFVLDRLRTSERGINIGDPATHAMLRQLGQHPGLPLTAEHADTIIETTARSPRTTETEVGSLREVIAQDAEAAAELARRDSEVVEFLARVRARYNAAIAASDDYRSGLIAELPAA